MTETEVIAWCERNNYGFIAITEHSLDSNREHVIYTDKADNEIYSMRVSEIIQ